MKKLIITGLIVGSIACASFVGAKDWSGEANWGNGHQRFVAELNLDAERAEKMSVILDSYREVPKLYFTNQSDKIPEFLAQKEAELAALLTAEELAQFKQSFADWAKSKKFGFMSFSYSQPQAPASPLPDALREEIRQTFDNELLQLRQQLQQQTLNA
jgi:hypothetical protein